jgi:hypothetical protein
VAAESVTRRSQLGQDADSSRLAVDQKTNAPGAIGSRQ